MPVARPDAAHSAVQQTVRELLQAVHDPQRAATLVAAVIAHHAPELRDWALALLCARHPKVRLPALLQPAVDSPAEARYQAIFGVRPSVTPAPLLRGVAGHTGGAAAVFRVDPELGRLVVALHRAAELRIWVLVREWVRQHGGSGWIARDDLTTLLREQGVTYSSRHLRRLLTGGEGQFWNVTRQRVYLRSWAHLAAALTQEARSLKTGTTERNRAGVRELYVPVGGSLEQWEAQLYAAWLAHRNNPTISRSQLSLLFGRDKTVLRRWERTRLAGRVTVRHNFAQCPNHETFFSHIPHYATSYVAWVRGQGRPQKVVRIRWQLPNSYLVGAIKQHHRKGQASKVRRRINRETETWPANERRGGWHRLYFDQAATLRQFVRKHPEVEGRYVWRGENRHRHGIFEINASGFALTHCLERVRPRDEQAFLLAQEGRA